MSNVFFEQSTRTLMSAIFLRKFVIIGWIFVAFMGQYGNVLSQNDSASSMKVIPLNSLVKYSTVMLRNNYLVPGKVFAVQKGEEFLLPVELGLNDTIEVETRDYDKLIFKFEVPMYDGTIFIPTPFELKVNENTPVKRGYFSAEGVVGSEKEEGKVYFDTRSIKRLKMNTIYELVITDDAYPFRIKVEPLNDASSFVDIVQLAELNKFQIRLKSGSEIDKLIKQKEKEFEKVGFYLIPVGLRISDPLTDDVTQLEATLRMVYKKKKK